MRRQGRSQPPRVLDIIGKTGNLRLKQYRPLVLAEERSAMACRQLARQHRLAGSRLPADEMQRRHTGRIAQSYPPDQATCRLIAGIAYSTVELA